MSFNPLWIALVAIVVMAVWEATGKDKSPLRGWLIAGICFVLGLRKVITYYMFLEFTDRRGKTRVLKSPASFPKMLEIMYNIADLAPQARLNDELDKMVGVIRRVKERQGQDGQ